MPASRNPAVREGRPLRAARAWIVTGALAGLPAATVAVWPGSASAATTLGASAAERGGRFFGTALSVGTMYNGNTGARPTIRSCTAG